MGSQPTFDEPPAEYFEPSDLSPSLKSAKARQGLKDQVMYICAGDVIKFNELWNSDVELFLLTFERFFLMSKQNG